LVDRLWYYLRPDEGDAFFLFWSKELLISVLIVAAFYLLSRLAVILLARVAARISALTRGELDGQLVERVTAPALALINCAGLYIAIRRLPLPERVQVVVSGALFIVNVGILSTIAYRIMDEMLNRAGKRIAGEEMSRQLMPLVQKLCSIFLFGTALIITMKHFNYDILSLVTALGVGSLAIGLAAKDTMANMVSGFTLMIDRPFRIGDRIQLGAQVGDVVDIGLRSTKIKGGDNTYLIIPNSELCNTTLINQAFPDSRGKGRVNLGIAYGSDVAKAKALLVATAAATPGVLSDPAPEAYFTSFGDSSLNLALFFWTDHYETIFAATDRINCAICTCFQDNGINIPYPTRTVLLEKDAANGPQN
jgi:MscS family membrane protein